VNDVCAILKYKNTTQHASVLDVIGYHLMLFTGCLNKNGCLHHVVSTGILMIPVEGMIVRSNNNEFD